jgi:hypothetical protein
VVRLSNVNIFLLILLSTQIRVLGKTSVENEPFALLTATLQETNLKSFFLPSFTAQTAVICSKVIRLNDAAGRRTFKRLRMLILGNSDSLFHLKGLSR